MYYNGNYKDNNENKYRKEQDMTRTIIDNINRKPVVGEIVTLSKRLWQLPIGTTLHSTDMDETLAVIRNPEGSGAAIDVRSPQGSHIETRDDFINREYIIGGEISDPGTFGPYEKPRPDCQCRHGLGEGCEECREPIARYRIVSLPWN